MTTKEPPSPTDDVARLAADLDEELKGIVSEMTEVLIRTATRPEPELEPAPDLGDDPDEVTLPDEFELLEPAEPLPQAAADPVILPDDFEIAAADISPAADHDHGFEFQSDFEIRDDFEAPLSDFTSNDWDEGPEAAAPPELAPEEQPEIKIAELTVREFSLLVERAVARGVRRALRPQAGDE